MPMIALDCIDENGHNIRRTPATAEQDEQLTQSIRALGVLQPVVLRHGDETGRYFIVAGHRRVRCARSAGLDKIAAEIHRGDMAEFSAVQAAENMVRVPMDPVGQWRAIVALQSAGYTLEGAGQALGLSVRRARQLDQLGHVIPEILDLMAGRGIPAEPELRAIASAPTEVQRAAWKGRANAFHSLPAIARACLRQRIPRAWAIFDIETAGVVFEEDLFAEAGSPDQFITSDVEGFVECQKKALFARVAARVDKGERVVLAKWSATGLKLPKGWQQDDSTIKKKYPAKGRLCLFTCVRDDGYAVGRIEEVAAFDAAAEAAKEKAAAARQAPQESTEDADDAAAGASLDRATATEPEANEPALTKRGTTMLAAMKTDALRQRLDAEADGSEGNPIQLGVLAAALVLALSADNVTVHGESSHWSRTRFDDLRGEIVSPPGTFLCLSDAYVGRLLAKALSRILRVTDPVGAKGSGVVAEWIGAMIDADRHLPRFDTAEFLACMGRDALQAVAEQHGRGGLKTAKGLRAALAGTLPDWRPASFGAPGPPPVAAAEIVNEEQEEAA